MPRQLFTNYGTAQFFECILERVNNYLEARVELPAKIRTRLTYYPRLVKDLVRALVLPMPEVNRIVADPTVCCSVMLEDYKSMAALFEDHLCKDALSLERILTDARYTERHTLRNDSEYMQLLQKLDPERHYRLSPEDKRADLAAQLATDSEKFWDKSAAWAYLYISTHREHTDLDLINRLKEDENYLYLAIYLLKEMRQLPAEAWASMVDLVHTPKWAFHCLRDELYATSEQQAALSNIIHQDPPWLAEWWHATRMQGEALNASFREAAKLAADHPCMPELYFCHKTITIRVKTYEEQGLKYGLQTA